MRRIPVAALFVALTLAGAASVQAQAAEGHQQHGEHTRGERGERAGRRGPGMFKDLNLTDAQKQQIKTIREKYEEQGKALREQMKPLREQFAAARKSGDKQKLEALRAQAEPQMKQMQDLRKRQMDEVRALLTPEQRATYDKHIADAKERFEKRGEKGRGAARGTR